MAYVGSTPLGYVRVCRRTPSGTFCRVVARAAFGDDATPSTPAVTSETLNKVTSSGIASVERLKAELNRFAAANPPRWADMLPVTNEIDQTTANRAVAIFVERAVASRDADLIRQAVAIQVRPTTDPTFGYISWVAQNLSMVTDTVKGYADSLKLPAAVGYGLSMKTVAIAAAAIVGAMVLFKKKGGRQGRR